MEEMPHNLQGFIITSQLVQDFLPSTVVCDMVVSINGGTLKTPQMIMFSRKTNGCWVPPF